MIKNVDKYGRETNATVIAAVSLDYIAALWNGNHRASSQLFRTIPCTTIAESNKAI